MSAGMIIKRLLLALPTLFGVSIIVFVLLRVIPGDPIAMMTPPGASSDDINKLRALYGLDKSILAQYGIWLRELVQGDLGTSISLRQGVGELIVHRLPATIELVLLSAIIVTFLCLLLSLTGSLFSRGIVGRTVDAVASTAQAIPDFLWGLLFILFLGVVIPIFPISGRINPRIDHDLVSQFYLLESIVRFDGAMIQQLMHHMFMPAIALAIPMTGIVTRMLKASLDEVMKQDYIIMARARGYSRGRILWREAMRNALIPTVALGGVQLTFLLGGTVLIERLFGYPGIGSMAIGAVIQRDLPLIQGVILTFAILFIAINLLVDLCVVLLNPRVRHG